ncbi:hypothetical protein FOA52_006874 [Chlamydomonas sp. UWO 241]|nr:hypothetical protein FOA52_006874 [Chlamydomonas sp. UWO 241]
MRAKPRPSWRAWLRLDVCIAIPATVSFAAIAYWACTSDVSDPEIAVQYAAQVDSYVTYLVPASCFFTAFVLNSLTMLFERDSQRMKLAFFGAYIQLLAASSDFLSYLGVAPIMRGYAVGGGVHMLRYVMWMFTTPAMIYLLSLLSDFRKEKVAIAISADVLMIASGLLGSILPSPALAAVCNMTSFSLFPCVMTLLWGMFDAAIASTINAKNETSLRTLRVFTLAFWFSFPIIWLASSCGLLSHSTEELLWTTCDFCGKVMFSSSLLYGNFLTLEQRKLVAMRIIEESNRIQVIKELQDLVEEKETFLSSMSHELRTPLNGIIGLSESILTGSCGVIGATVAKVMNTIKISGGRLLNLINDILDSASVQKGSLVVKHERVNLQHLVADVLEICAPLTRRGVTLQSTIPDMCPVVQGDAGRLVQILHNLVGNSCKFTHKGCITVSAEWDGSDVEVSVADTGIGIAADKLDQIFMPFKQSDNGTTRTYGGTGLGLSLVKQLVEAHHSKIRVASVPGEGAAFSFLLHTWDAAAINSSEGAAAAAPTTSGLAGGAAAASAPGAPAPACAAAAPAAPAAPAAAAAAPAADAAAAAVEVAEQLSAATSEKRMLAEQLDEVSAECDRLQALFDGLN